MIRLTGIGAAAVLWAGMGATAAQAADARQCLTEAEAQSVFVAVAPAVIQAVGQKCAASLPPSAMLRAGLPALVARYMVAADLAWPQASVAMAKLAGPDMKGIDPSMIRTMAGPMIGGMAAGQVKPADCPMIDRMVTLIDPLPPANTAALIVLAAGAASKKQGDKGPFAICPATPSPIAPLPPK